MKKKMMIMLLSLTLAFSAFGAISIAAQASTDLVIKDVNYADPWYGPSIMVSFEGTTTNTVDWAPVDTSKIELKNASGVAQTITAETQGSYVLINRNLAAPEVGSKVTFKAGFFFDFTDETKTDLVNEVLAADVTYEYAASGSPWVLYVEGEDEITELKIAESASATYGYDVNLMNDTTWGAPSLLVNFVSANTFNMYQPAFAKDKIVYTNAYGENVNVIDCINVGNTHFLMRLGESMENPYYAMMGDRITFQKGFALTRYEEISEDITFIVPTNSNTSLKLFSESDIPSSFEITNSNADKDLAIDATLQLNYAIPENTYATPYFTSSDSAIATVTKTGLVTGISTGEVTITAHIGNVTKDFVLSIKEAQDISAVEIISPYRIWVVKGEALVIPDFKAHAIFADGSFGAEFDLEEGVNFIVPEFDTSAAGEKILDAVIKYKETDYSVRLYVTVYEIGDVKISEIGIVDWFSYALFVQYPNSTSNTANITNPAKINGVLENIEYKRADGTPVTINGFYMLSGGNIALFMFNNLTEANYKEYYLAGDILTLKAGMKIWMWTGEKEATGSDNNAIKEGTGMYIVEGILSESISYKYDGNVWGMYLEYTDITVKSPVIELQIGKKADAGVTRVPANATTGILSYSSSDSSVATVTAKGSITGIKAGTAVITVTIDGGTAGVKTQTITVNVSDYIDGIVFDPTSLSVKKGGTLDLSKVTAKLHYAGGSTTNAIDLSNATVSGFDASQIGEQTVIVSVVIDNVTYSGSLTVNVEKAGCFGSISDNAAMSALIVTLLGIVFLKTNKSKKQK